MSTNIRKRLAEAIRKDFHEAECTYLDLDGAKCMCDKRAQALLPIVEREIAASRGAVVARVEALTAVHARYFDLDGKPGYDDTTPEPEDVWRYDRDFRAALTPDSDHSEPE